jgi:hypothetical protein
VDGDIARIDSVQFWPGAQMVDEVIQIDNGAIGYFSFFDANAVNGAAFIELDVQKSRRRRLCGACRHYTRASRFFLMGCDLPKFDLFLSKDALARRAAKQCVIERTILHPRLLQRLFG